MESQIFKYTEFLLTTHSCVIIPEFGSFIINTESAFYNDNGTLCPPYSSIIFNQDLKHNDGLIATHIQNTEGVTYEAACKKIKYDIIAIIQYLQQHNTISCANLGDLILNEDKRIIFKPNSTFTHPIQYGLSNVNLKHLTWSDYTLPEEIKYRPKGKYKIARIAAAAAIALLFIAPSINIGEYNGSDSVVNQRASIISLPSPFTSPVKIEIDTTSFDQADNNPTAIEDMPSEYPKAEETSHRTYYIVVASEDSNSIANRRLERFKATEFPSADIIKTSEKYRIYIASFDVKEDAENYLNEFRKEHPKHETAWLHSKRN